MSPVLPSADLPFAGFSEAGDLSSAGPGNLAPGEIHLWLADLRLPTPWLERCGRVLTPDERDRRARFRFERHRRRFQARRGLLRLLLGRYLDQDPGSLAFGYGEQGKPFLEGPPRGPSFNISDSEEGLILAFTRWHADAGPGPLLGVDLELRRPMRNPEGLGERVFSDDDREVWRSLPCSRRDLAFLLLWTRKEAILKATGEGILASPRRYSVTLRPGEPARLLAIDGQSERARGWHLRHLGAESGTLPAAGSSGAGTGRGDTSRSGAPVQQPLADDELFVGALATYGAEPEQIRGFRLRP